MPDVFNQLCAVIEHEPVDWNRFDELLSTVDDINAFDEADEETLLSRFIMDADFYKNGGNMPVAIQHFIDNGYDVSANKGINGGLCLSNLCWSSYDENVITAAKVLLDAGSPIEYVSPDDEPDESSGVIGSIEWKVSGAWVVDKDYSWANILEAYYSLVKAVEDGKDYSSISSYHDCVGKRLTSTGVIGDLPLLSSKTNRTDFSGSIVFNFGDMPLVISEYMDLVINPVLVQNKSNDIVNTDGVFTKVIGHVLVRVNYINQSMFYFDFDNGVRIVFTSLPLEGRKRFGAFEIRDIETVNLYNLAIESVSRCNGGTYASTVKDYEEAALMLVSSGSAVLIYPEESTENAYNIGAIRCNLEMVEEYNKMFPISPSGTLKLFTCGDQPRALRVPCGEKYLYIQTDEYPELEIKLSNEAVDIEEPTLLRRLPGIHVEFINRQ